MPDFLTQCVQELIEKIENHEEYPEYDDEEFLTEFGIPLGIARLHECSVTELLEIVEVLDNQPVPPCTQASAIDDIYSKLSRHF